MNSRSNVTQKTSLCWISHYWKIMRYVWEAILQLEEKKHLSYQHMRLVCARSFLVISPPLPLPSPTCSSSFSRAAAVMNLHQFSECWLRRYSIYIFCEIISDIPRRKFRGVNSAASSLGESLCWTHVSTKELHEGASWLDR